MDLRQQLNESRRAKQYADEACTALVAATQQQAKEQLLKLSNEYNARCKAIWDEREAYRQSATLGHEELHRRRLDIEEKEAIIAMYGQQLADRDL